MKTLVAYFSASNNTAVLAKKLAEVTGSDLFEIKPTKPYTKKDLNWMNPVARCNKEKFGKKDVPIDAEIENFDEYSTFYIGFPIWYYGAPNIIETFLKSYDFSGKNIALFATSGGSDIGKTAQKLLPLLSGDARITAADVFPADAEAEALEKWAQIE